MHPLCCEALLIPLVEGLCLCLDEDRHRESPTLSEFETLPGLPTGWKAVGSNRRLDAPLPTDRPPILYYPDSAMRGLHSLRLFELRSYSWELIGNNRAGQRILLTSSLQQSVERELWRNRGRYGNFQFINYLGSAWIEVKYNSLPLRHISFEVVSPKLNYEVEYRSLVENIGAECQQLLLEWGTPTTLTLAIDPAKQTQFLLQQFLFLRHVLGPDKLDLYLEIILRNSHSRLRREVEWKPVGIADATLLANDPVRRGRDWQRRSDAKIVPAQVQVERRFQSKDTPPNQFVRFALLQFRELCESVLRAKRNGRPAFAPDDAVSLEATSMLRSLDILLAHPLFRDVGELRRLPFESITLQRREGYREILSAWLMLNAAAQLDWVGQEDAYDGTSRNVATLYEYWLYFVLVRAFRDRLGMIPDPDPFVRVEGALPFCCRADDGRLVINLRQGEASFSRFTWKKTDQKLRIHFFFNRSFGRKGVGERGSYSRTFRPDYTLVIIPEEFDRPKWKEAETEAEIAGTVKRADLYKMHTYNEAIRRTVGSYVLYPGPTSSGHSRFERYHEIIPGIGAFAMRPIAEGEPRGLDAVCDFIQQILSHQLDRFTQSHRISLSTEEIIREPPVKYSSNRIAEETVSLPAATAILGYMRKGEIEAFATRKIFYCRATDENGMPVSLDLSLSLGTVFIGWWGPRTGPFLTANWMARVTSCRLVSPEIIILETGIKPSKAGAHYLLFKLADVSHFTPRNVTSLVKNTNTANKGSIFRTFQTTLAYVFQQSLADETND
jgi:predicted component of viral defense system (DUF524 family)